ncbi:MAG TPA: NAD synthetase, partial [Tistrella mobilis]|nr:NAD synthetase [Tistrella mobilis]
VVLGVIIGGAAGTIIALRIQMTAMPQLVAAFHSLVGLAAVFVAIAAYYAPEAYGIGTAGSIKVNSLIELSLGSAIGAITFTGSIIAFGKLQGIFKSAPVRFPMQHPINLGLGIAVIALIVVFCLTEAPAAFWLLTLIALALGILLIIPIG